MRLTFLFAVVFCLTSACRPKKHIEESHPFSRGFYAIPWGAPASAIDSLAAKDTAWTKISGVANLESNGSIVVVKRNEREYYLEFDSQNRFFMMNYISDQKDLDTVRYRLHRYYGNPDRSEKSNDNFQDQIWHIDSDSMQLEIQLLVTPKQYAFKVMRKIK